MNKNSLFHRIIVTLASSCFLLVTVWLIFSSGSLSAQEDTVADTAIEADSSDESIEFNPLVYTLTIDGPIGVVTFERVAEAVRLADEDNAELLIIRLDTPGGFMSATESINQTLLNSPVPVCVYVWPSGGHATSAGVYITYAAHFAAMAPSTNIGAAHPVAGGGEEMDSVMNEKVTNTAVAQIKAAAEKRGRNVEWAEKAVRQSVSITNKEALEMNVVNFVAKDIEDLLSQLHGREIETSRGTRTLNLEEADVHDLEISFMQRLRSLITDPNVVFILFSIGGLGIMMELYNPGSYAPGIIGAISLIIAFYSAQTLPVSYAGVALILLAIILFIAEIKVISHGLLTLGGAISLGLGGVLLIDDPSPAVQVSKVVLFTVAGFALTVVGLAVWLIAKASRRQVFIGEEGMIGKSAEARGNGFVYVDGALWKAECDESLEPGTKVEIVGLNKLTLKVKTINS